MSTGRENLEALRAAFDSAFAAQPAAAVERVDLVALRAGAQSWAVRVSDIGGVVRFGGVAVLPCDEPAMLGIAAVRGAPLPVYDLAALLGHGAARAPRWMMLSTGAERVALAFDEIEEYLRVPLRELVAASQHANGAGIAPSEAVHHGSSLRPVVPLAAVLRRLEQRIAAPTKGR